MQLQAKIHAIAGKKPTIAGENTSKRKQKYRQLQEKNPHCRQSAITVKDVKKLPTRILLSAFNTVWSLFVGKLDCRKLRENSLKKPMQSSLYLFSNDFHKFSSVIPHLKGTML